ncbi:MAG: AAA family ATPase [Gammaproteobacteria bacterium]|jgi:broad-specificity NMP kinase|nr:AAA family ATPase [Gammaproteobacteria bacterium]MBT4493211.1 AAA family ATPase [Gammaproteobacteria bacterium]MBT7371363.1 AAA family ATPase [Gammaproteobacteria bacterium]
MHLIFLHGVPGVGKRTIAKQLAQELGFAFLDFQNLTQLLGPVFGYSSETFGELRNASYKQILESAMQLPDDGLIASFTYDQHIDLGHYATFVESARASEGIGLFLGLTCDDEELKGRVDAPDRHSAKISDLQLMEDDFGNSQLDMPDLPGPSITINTTGETPEHTVHNIMAMLPDGMKSNISF